MGLNDDRTLFGGGGKAFAIHGDDHGNAKTHPHVPHVHDLHKDPDGKGWGSGREPSQVEKEMIKAAFEPID